MTTSQRQALADLADPATLPDPYPVLAGLRKASPFAEFDGALVVVGRYADISAVLRHPNASSQRGRSLLAPAVPRRTRERPSFLSLDAPDHTRLRRLVSKAFTPRRIAMLEPRIRAITNELLTAAGAAGHLELVSQLAYPLPVRIISEMLGVPVSDHPRFAGWSARLAHSLQPDFRGRHIVGSGDDRGRFVGKDNESQQEHSGQSRAEPDGGLAIEGSDVHLPLLRLARIWKTSPLPLGLDIRISVRSK